MKMNACPDPAVWFPTVRAGSGTDVFSELMVEQLRKRGLRAEIAWLPLRAEYAPWSVKIPQAPSWANIVHINTWLHPCFLPDDLAVVATLHHSTHHADLEVYKDRLRAAYHKYWIKPFELRTLRRADRVAAVSRFAAETARATLLDRPMQVVCNGVDVERFRPPERQRRGIHRPFRLLYVGKWASLKGVHLLALIMRELGEGFQLSYTGGASSERDRPGMPGNMHDIGRLDGSDAVRSAMQEADALLLPSRSEGFPMVVVEAQSCGLPVIASDVPSLAEAVHDGTTGYLARRDDVADFCAACRKLSADAARYERMAIASRERTVARFSVEHMVEDYLKIYEDLLEERENTNQPTCTAAASADSGAGEFSEQYAG
jgi:glycosyltransferase involved in cell wall biosynthesis